MILTKALSFCLRGVNQLYKRFNLKFVFLNKNIILSMFPERPTRIDMIADIGIVGKERKTITMV